MGCLGGESFAIYQGSNLGDYQLILHLCCCCNKHKYQQIAKTCLLLCKKTKGRILERDIMDRLFGRVLVNLAELKNGLTLYYSYS